MSRALRVVVALADAAERGAVVAQVADWGARLPARVVGEAGDGVTALEMVSRGLVDVLLLEPELPQMSGIELARHLAGREGRPAVVFLSRFDPVLSPLMQALELDVLEKPVEAARLMDALMHARKLPAQAAESMRVLQRAPRRYFSCLERGKIKLVPVTEVIYLRAELKYVTARTLERDYLLDASLTQLEQEFHDRFVRVHRNCLVSRTWMAGFERAHDVQGEPHWLVKLRGLPERLPVSRRQWPLVRGVVA